MSGRGGDDAGFESDFFAWTQRQAKLLRAFEKSYPRLNSDIDFAHVADAVEGLGRMEVVAVKQLVRRILALLIRGAVEPQADAFALWRAEATAAQLDLQDRYLPSMRRRVDVAKLWQAALKVAAARLAAGGAGPPQGLPEDCPLKLADLLKSDFSFDASVKALRPKGARGNPLPRGEGVAEGDG